MQDLLCLSLSSLSLPISLSSHCHFVRRWWLVVAGWHGCIAFVIIALVVVVWIMLVIDVRKLTLTYL